MTSRGTALVVDDSPMIVRLLTITLQRDGWEVIAASSASDGVAALGEEPDLVLLDGVLPDADGSTVLSEVRRTLPGARVIVVSGLEDGEGQMAGADAYIRKPFTPPDVLEVVARVRGGAGS